MKLPNTSWLVYLVLLGFSIYLHLAHATPFDDPFIHFRIADNLARQGLPYFNLNDPVQGSSSPLWTALLSMLTSTGIPVPQAAGLINALTLVSLFRMVILLLRPLRISRFLQCVLSILVVLTCLPSSLGLMETPFAVLLFIGAVFIMPTRPLVGLLLLSCASTCRLEFLPLVPLVMILLLKQGNCSVSAILLAAAGPLVIYASLAWHFFGSVLPHTIIAKSVSYQLSFSEALRHVVVSLLCGSSNFIGNVLVICGVLSLVVWGLYRSFIEYGLTPKFTQVLLLLAQPSACVALYLSQSAHTFPWYTPLLLPGLLIGASLAAPSRPNRIGVLYAVVLGLRASVVGAFSLWATLFSPCSFPYGHETHKAQRLLEIATALSFMTPSDAVVMAPEVGALGWGSSLDIFDTVGLVTARAIEYQSRRARADNDSGDLGVVPFEAVQEIRPAWVVGWEPLLPSSSQFESAGYHQVFIDSNYECPFPEIAVWKR